MQKNFKRFISTFAGKSSLCLLLLLTSLTVGLAISSLGSLPDTTLQLDVDDTAGVAFSAASLLPGGEDPNDYTFTISPSPGTAHGAVSLNADGSGIYTFTDTGAPATSDAFAITITETADPTNTEDAKFIVELYKTPLAVSPSQSITMFEGTSNYSYDLSATATDPLDRTLSWSIETAPANGSANITADTLTYTPQAGTSSDSLWVTASNGFLTSARYEIQISVTATAGLVAAADDTANTDVTASAGILIDVLANDTYPSAMTTTISAVTQPTSGTGSVTVEVGEIRFVPASDSPAADSFTYTISSTDGYVTLTDTATVSLSIAQTTPSPVPALAAEHSSYTIDVDTPLSVVFTLEDTAATDISNEYTLAVDTDNAALFAGACIPVLDTASATQATYTLLWTPEASAAGTCTLTITATNTTDPLRIATIGIPISVEPPAPAPNEAPVIQFEQPLYTIDEDDLLTAMFTLSDADTVDIENDYDFAVTCNDGSLFAAGGATLTPGTADAASIPYSLTWQPVVSASGSCTITVTATDKNDSTSSVSESISVVITAVNNAPVAVDDAFDYTEDTPLAIGIDELLSNDNDIDSIISFAAFTQPDEGSLAENSGVLTFTPTADSNNTVTFTYTITDGTLTDTATVTLTCLPVNDAPVAADDAFDYTEDTPLAIGIDELLSNDNDIDSAISFAAFTQPDEGSLAENSGVLTFTPAADSNNTVTFTYTITDGALTDTATVTLTCLPVNDAPTITVITPQPWTMQEDTGAAFTVRISDPDEADISQLVPTVVSRDVTVLPASGIAISAPIAVSGDSQSVDFTLTFTTSPNQNAESGISIDLSVSDDRHETAAETYMLTVEAVNDPPVAKADTYTIDEDTATEFDVLQNDSDVDIATNADVLTIVGPISGTAAGGTVDIASTGDKLTYTPPQDYYGADSFSYTVSDIDGATASATVTITINPVNDAPVFSDLPTNNTIVISEDEPDPSKLKWTFNVSDVEAASNDALMATAAVTSGSKIITHAYIEPVDSAYPERRVLVMEQAPDENGTVTINLTVTDNIATTAVTLTITVDAVNDAPVAVKDAFTYTEDTPLEIPISELLKNDSDIDSKTGDKQDYISFSDFTAPSEGTLARVGDTLQFTPVANSENTVTFTYTITDANPTPKTATATVTLNCQAINDTPVLDDIAPQTMLEDGVLPITLTYSDLETAHSDLFVTAQSSNTSIVSDLGLAIQSTVTGGTLTITPLPDKNTGSGTITISVTVSDRDISVTKSFPLTITPVADAPVARPDHYTVVSTRPVTLTPLENDFDVDGDSLSIQINAPSNGTLTELEPLGTGRYTYISNSGFSGTETISYTITDDSADHKTATGTITVEVTEQGLTPALPAIAPVVTYLDSVPYELPFSVVNAEMGAFDLSVSCDNTTVISAVSIDNLGASVSAQTTADHVLYMTLAATGTANVTLTLTNGALVDTVSFRVTVTGANTAPVANDDTYPIQERQNPCYFDVLLNDTDTELPRNIDLLEIVSQPSYGVASIVSYDINQDGNEHLVIKYEVTNHSDAYLYHNDTDKFVYRIADAAGATDDAEVSVERTPMDNAPYAHMDIFYVPYSSHGTTIQFSPLDNDFDYDDRFGLHKNSALPEKQTMRIISLEDTLNVDNSAAAIAINANEKEIDFTCATPGWYLYQYQVETTGWDSANVGSQNSNIASIWIGVYDEHGKIPPRTTGFFIVVTEDDYNDTPNTVDFTSASGNHIHPSWESGMKINLDQSRVDAAKTILVDFTANNEIVTFKTVPNANGTVVIPFTVESDAGVSNISNFTIYVVAANDPPTIELEDATQSTITVKRGIPTEIPLIIEDIDGDNILLTWKVSNSVNIPADNTDHISVYQDTSSGATNRYILKINALRSESNTVSNTDINPVTVTVAASDGVVSAAQAVVVTVEENNRPPVATTFDYVMNEDAVGIAPVMTTTSDPDGDALSILISDTDDSLGLFLNGQPSTLPGELRVSGKNILLLPRENYYTNADDTLEIRYRLKEVASGLLTSEIGVVTVTINPVNDAPILYALQDDYSVQEDDQAYTIEFNARDADGDSIQFHVDWTDKDRIENIEILGTDTPVNGIYSLTLKVTLAENRYHGDNNDATLFDTITITADDGNGESNSQSSADITLTITSDNDGIIPLPDTLENGYVRRTIQEDTALTLDFATLYRDIEGDEFSIISLQDTRNGLAVRAAVNKTTVTFTPAKDYFTPDNPSDAQYGYYKVTLSDVYGATCYAEVMIDITPVNDPPTAPAITVTISEDGSCTVNPFETTPHAADVDDDLASLSLSAVTSPGDIHGSITWNAGDRSFDYVPNADWSGRETIPYTVTDPDGESASGTVTIVVTPVPDDPRISFKEPFSVPSAAEDINTWSFDEDTTGQFTFCMWTPEEKVNLSLIITEKNAPNESPVSSLIDGSKLTYNLIPNTDPSYRVVTIVPRKNAFGSFLLEFQLTEGTKVVNRTVTVNINPVNDLPALSGAATKSGDEDTVVTDKLTATDVETANNKLLYSVKGKTEEAGAFRLVNGSLTLTRTGTGCTWVFTPDANWYGSETFTVVVTDEAGATAEQEITVTINPVNDAPTAPLDIALDKTQYKGGTTAVVTFPPAEDVIYETQQEDLLYEISVNYGSGWTVLTGNHKKTTADPLISYAFSVDPTNTENMLVRVRTIDTTSAIWGTTQQYSAYTTLPTAERASVDSIAPAATHTPPTAGFFTNQDYVLNLTVTDTGAGASGVADVTPSGGAVSGAAQGSIYPFTIIDNGVYSFTMTDQVGNSAAYSVTIGCIDKLNPKDATAAISNTLTDANGIPMGDANNPLGFTLTYADEDATATDAESGVAMQQYLVLDAGAAAPDSSASWNTYPSSGGISITEKGTWSLYARTVDNAGNDTITKIGTYTMTDLPPVSADVSGTVYEHTVDATKLNQVDFTLVGSDADGDVLTYSFAADDLTALEAYGTLQTISQTEYRFIHNGNGAPPFQDTLTLRYTVTDGTTPVQKTVTITVIEVNDRPEKPTGITAPAVGSMYKAGDHIDFSWSAGTDEETVTGNLSYNVYISKNDGAWALLSPQYTPLSYSYVCPDETLSSLRFKVTTVDDDTSALESIDDVKTNVYLLDNQPPTATVAATSGGSAVTTADACAQEVTFTLSFADAGGSGLDTCNYAITGSSTKPADNEWRAAQGTVTASEELIGSYYVHTLVTDHAGNETYHCDGPYRIVNTVPLAEEQEVTVAEAESVTITLTAYDRDADDYITAYTIKTPPAYGTLTPDSAGNLGVYIYTHNGDDPIANDSFTFAALDNNGGVSAAVTVTIKVTEVNDPPVLSALPPSFTMDEDDPDAFTFSIADPDDPLDQLHLTVSSSDQSVIPDQNLVASIDGSGNVSVTVRPSQDANTDLGGDVTLTVTIRDKNGLEDSQSITVTVNPVNDPPVSENHFFLLMSGADTVESTVIASDVENDPLTFTLQSDAQLQHGSVIVNPDGTFAYHLTDSSYEGALVDEYFTVDISDGTDTTTICVYISRAVISTEDIDVEQLITLPTNVPNDYTGFTVSSNDEGILKSLNCTLEQYDDGSAAFLLSLKPEANKFGELSISISFNGTDAPPLTVDVKILPENDPPQTKDEDYRTDYSTAITQSIYANDAVDGIYSVTEFDFSVDNPLHQPQYGTVVIDSAAATFTYTPDPDMMAAYFSGAMTMRTQGQTAHPSDSVLASVTPELSLAAGRAGIAPLVDTFYVTVTEKDNNPTANPAANKLPDGVINSGTDDNLSVLVKYTVTITEPMPAVTPPTPPTPTPPSKPSPSQNDGDDEDDSSAKLQPSLTQLERDRHFAYISGYPDGTVRPQQYITREEVSAILYNLHTETWRGANSVVTNPFTDVSAENWSNTAISSLHRAGLISGYPDDSFLPKNNITRGEFAAMVSRFLNADAAEDIYFTDLSDHWAKDAINRIAAKGWISGYSDGTFRPNQYITRAETAAMLNRILSRCVTDVDDLHADMKVWPDNADAGAWYYFDIQEATNSHSFTRKYSGKTDEVWTGLR